MIRLSDVRFCYPTGEFRLALAEMSVAAGEKVAVIGPSGSGKTRRAPNLSRDWFTRPASTVQTKEISSR